MLNKLRLFVKEYMNAILSGIGGIIMGFAFASFIHADSKDTQDPKLYFILALVGLVFGIGFWTTAIILQWKKERIEAKIRDERFEQDKAREKREIERSKGDEELLKKARLEVEKLEREKPYPGSGAL